MNGAKNEYFTKQCELEMFSNGATSLICCRQTLLDYLDKMCVLECSYEANQVSQIRTRYGVYEPATRSLSLSCLFTAYGGSALYDDEQERCTNQHSRTDESPP